MAKFSVTYEIVTEESAAEGDAAERGYEVEDGTLREAVRALFGTRTNLVDGIESISTDSWPCRDPRWITVTNGMEFETGDNESRSLHLPRELTRATRRRIARLCGVKLAAE